jgi:dTDP-4-amino-4,6-dideoxygalactose transaminase
MPSFTFLATARAAGWAGLEPFLCDISPRHWHLDPEHLERALESDEAAAVLAVSAFGTPPPAETRERWERACSEAGVPLVVDSAAGFGAVAEDGVPIGAQGDVEVVSFHATKPFAIGEGGAVFTRDRELRERLELATNFGFRGDRSVGFAAGLNAKMSELHAATALAVLDEIDSILARRREAAATLRGRAGATISWQQGSERSTWQFLPVALTDRQARQRLVEVCGERIAVRTYYEPLHELLPGLPPTVGGDLTATADLHERILCLPLANDTTEAELETIAAALGAV